MQKNITANRLAIFAFLLMLSLHVYPNSSVKLANEQSQQDSSSTHQKTVLSIEKRQGKYLLHIPDTLLNRDFLYGARIVNLSRQHNTSAGLALHNPIVIRFVKNENTGVIEMRQWTSTAVFPREEPAKEIIKKNNIMPVIRGFKYKTVGSDNEVEVADYFAGVIPEVNPLPKGASQGHLNTKLSEIISSQTLFNRINIVTRYVYTGGRLPFEATICYTIMLLPEEPMHPRLADERINYFSTKKELFDTSKAVKDIAYANRWRMEPKAEDEEKWKSGELVEPQKPIIFYFDPATPPLVKKYAKQGILAWNIAFEKLGFKKAIQVKDFPKGTFMSEDMGVNVFRYIPNEKANASGPSWIDPRSGEIIQADIIWWHNVMDLLQTWRFVQTSAVDPAARPAKLSEKVWGDMIRYAVAHETGHTLGLKHNFRGSYSYPSDSLRSASFTKKFGTTSTIMDYARFNFVAQPGDLERGVRLTPPLLGVQDLFAIQWGYISTKGLSGKEEKKKLNDLFISHGDDPKYLFAPSQSLPISSDPSAQSEQLGNDLLVSTNYGIKNLHITMENLPEWTIDEGQDFSRLQHMYEAIVKQFYGFLRADAAYLGGVYHYPGLAGEFTVNYSPVALTKQKEALAFGVKQIRLAPSWLGDETIYSYIGHNTTRLKHQESLMGALFDHNFLERMTSSNYPLNNYIEDIINALTQKIKLDKKFTNDMRLQYTLAKLLLDSKTKLIGSDKNGFYNAKKLEAINKNIKLLTKRTNYSVVSSVLKED